MEDERANPQLSWQQSAAMRACAAAELGGVNQSGYDRHDLNEALAIPNSRIAVHPWTTVNPGYRTSASCNNPNPTYSIGNTYAADVSYNDGLSIPVASHPETFGSGVTTAHTDYDNSSSFVNQNPFTTTVAAGIDYNNGIALTPYWGDAATTGHADHHAFMSSPPHLNENPFTIDPSYNEGMALPIASHPSLFGPGVASAYTNSHNFAPMPGPNLWSLTDNTSHAGFEYPNGIALSTAPTHYDWDIATAPALTHPYLDANSYIPDASLSTMSPYAPATTDNNYQTLLPANSLHTQSAAAIEPPTMAPITRDHASALSDLDQHAPSRPTCTICDKSFSRQADLDRHSRKHQAGFNVFRCRAAGCGFSNCRKDKLDAHIRRRHPGLVAAPM